MTTHEEAQVEVLGNLGSHRRRRTTENTGRGLEMTGHAIEHLCAAESLDIWPYTQEGRLEALAILKSANRKIYYSCPVIEPLHDRIMKILVGLLNTILPD